MINYPELTPLLAGTSRDYTLRVPRDDGTAYAPDTTPFDGTEELTAAVSLGLDQPMLLSPGIAWDVNSGWQIVQFVVSFQDADAGSAGLVPGDYVLQCKALKAGRTANLFVGYLPVQQASGTAAAPPVYGSLDDLRIYCAWIDRLDHPSKRAQFLRERNRARTWYDQLMQRHFRASGYGISTLGIPIGGIGPFRSGAANTWLQQQLDANTLMVTDDIREVLAKKAIGFALEFQPGGMDGTSYSELSARLHAEADNLALMTTPGLDLNGSGWPALVIDLSTCDALWA